MCAAPHVHVWQTRSDRLFADNRHRALRSYVPRPVRGFPFDSFLQPPVTHPFSLPLLAPLGPSPRPDSRNPLAIIAAAATTPAVATGGALPCCA